VSVAQKCFVCATRVEVGQRLVVVQNGHHRPHCSERCLNVTVRGLHTAALKRRRARRITGGTFGAVALCAAILWKHHAPHPRVIGYEPPEIRPKRVAPPPVFLGPAWPPTDEDWTYAFDRVSWTFPLPGPARRSLTEDPDIHGPAPAKSPAPACREEGHCGIDVGGELWGEHVYAALDGVVDHIQRNSTERGGVYVRVAHLGGAAFTQYFHLAAVPRLLARGAHVRAGEVIGLLGDTGVATGKRYLHFALSVRPSPALPEIYWDPTPWLRTAKLRTPPRGTVAGLLPLRER